MDNVYIVYNDCFTSDGNSVSDYLLYDIRCCKTEDEAKNLVVVLNYMHNTDDYTYVRLQVK